MPQTREHLAILDLLHVRRGIVALTKADLVDEEWLELVREEVAEYLLPTTLAHSPIVSVSAYTMQGIPELLAQLEIMLDTSRERQNIARPRLPVDRVFTLTGFGTIVTGTLLDGNFKIGQEIEILPQGLKTRIRGLQTHRNKVDVAQPGSRVAMNLASVSRANLARGDVVALPGQLRPTMLVDAHIQLLAAAPRSLTHNTQVDFYSGSQEVPTRVRLLDVEELQPGQSAWVQLRLSRPAVLARRDRFILRIPSPSATIGGGEIIDVQPRYHRRFQAAILSRLETLEHGVPEELVLAALDRRTRIAGTPNTAAKGQAYKAFNGYELAEIAKQSNLARDVTQQTLETLLQEGRVRRIGAAWFAQSVWDALIEETMRLLSEQHRQYPLRSGLAKEEWRSRLGLSSKMAGDVFATLQTEAIVADATTTGSIMRLPNFVPSFSKAQQHQIEQLLQRFHQNPYTPPDRNEAEAALGAEALNALIEQGQLVKLGDGVLFLRETYDQAIATLVQFLREHETITVAEARDVLGATRKYILPLLEHMDTLKITRRLGDQRVLGTPT